MKMISKPSLSRRCFTALCLFASLASANAQDPAKPKLGYVRLVHAVAQGSGSLHLKIDGEDLNPDGYNLGDATGGIGLKPGTHHITITRDGVKEGTTRVNVAADDTTTLIPFAEKVPASDDEPAHWIIRILRLKQRQPEEGRTATFVSVANEPEITVELAEPGNKWSKTPVKRLATAQLPIKVTEGYVPIRTKGGDLESIPLGDPGNYVVVLYNDDSGKLRSLNFRDYKFLTAD